MNKPTQAQMFYMAQQKSADANSVFLEMLKGDEPLTHDELKGLIKKRPALWGRFSNWLEVLQKTPGV